MWGIFFGEFQCPPIDDCSEVRRALFFNLLLAKLLVTTFTNVEKAYFKVKTKQEIRGEKWRKNDGERERGKKKRKEGRKG